MDAAIRNASLTELKQNPEPYKGKLFVFGGIIVSDTVTTEGSLLEAIYATVDSRGDLKDIRSSDGRLLALFPKESGILDPVIFQKGRRITLAAEFLGTKPGKLGDVPYVYPFFRIRELYLWEKERAYYYSPYYPYYPYDPFYYDPFYFDTFFGFRHFRHRW